MGSRSKRTYRAAIVGVALTALVALSGSPGAAQDGDLCYALTDDDLSAAVPGTYDAPGPFPGTCQWHGVSEAGDAIDIILYSIPGSASDLGLAASGAAETSVAGHAAFTMIDPSTDPPGGVAAVDLGDSVTLMTVSTSDPSIDLVAAATQLVEVAVGRIAAEPPSDTAPDPASDTPDAASDASTHGDPCDLFATDELSALMGADLSAYGDTGSCRWDSADGGSSISVAFDQAGLTAIESIFPGGEQVTLGGQPAYQVDQGFSGFGAYQVSIDLGPDTISLLVMSTDAALDVAVIARQLTETALTRGLQVLPEPESGAGSNAGTCQLASPAEIATAAGLKIELALQDYESSCVYQGGEGIESIAIFITSQDPSTFEAMITAVGATQIEGPGDTSWWWKDSAALFTRQGDLALQVIVTVGEETSEARLQEMATAIMEALLAT